MTDSDSRLDGASRPASRPAPHLTRRETEVARPVARALCDKEIAAELGIARRTAEGRVERVLAGLGFAARTRIATWINDNDDDPAGRAGRV